MEPDQTDGQTPTPVNDRATLEKFPAVGAPAVASVGKAGVEPITQRLQRLGLGLKGTPKANADGRVLYVLAHCPLKKHSNGGSASITEFPDGGLVFRCLHRDCDGMQWSDLVALHPDLDDLGDHPKFDHQEPEFVPLSSIAPQQVSWLWHGHIPLGKVTLWFGLPGVGKGWAFADVAAAITTGRALPDGVSRAPAAVIILEAEDGLADTLRVRIDALGGEVGRVYVLKWGRLSLNARGLAAIRKQVEATKPLLVIVDPLVAFLGGTVDLHRSNQVRPVFAGLSAIAEDHGCAILVVHHVNKSGQQRVMLRAAGSLDIMAAVRSAHLFGVSTADETQRAMFLVKNNLTGKHSAVGYQITDDGRFSWTGPSRLTVEDVLGSARDSGGGRQAAREFLRRVLSKGSRLAQEVQEEADAHLIARATLRRAFTELGIVATAVYHSGKKKGISHWTWAMPQALDSLFGDQDSLSAK